MKNRYRLALVTAGLFAATPAIAQGMSVDSSTGRSPADGNGRYAEDSGVFVTLERLRTASGLRAELDDGYMMTAVVDSRVGTFHGEVEAGYQRAFVHDVSRFNLTSRGTFQVPALSATGTRITAPVVGDPRVRGLRAHNLEAGLRIEFPDAVSRQS